MDGSESSRRTGATNHIQILLNQGSGSQSSSKAFQIAPQAKGDAYPITQFAVLNMAVVSPVAEVMQKMSRVLSRKRQTFGGNNASGCLVQ